MVIRVRVAGQADQPALIDFIRDHWSATHIFAERSEVFDWQHGPSSAGGSDRVNMILAESIDDEGNSDVLGILGFIPMGQWDPELGDQDVLLAIWKVRDEVPPGLGLRLLKQIDRELGPRLIGAIGISDMVKPIYRLLKYEVGTMVQSAVFNPHIATFAVAEGVPDTSPQEPDEDLALEPLGHDAAPEVKAAVDAFSRAQCPAKSLTYLVERYLNHPWYSYDLRVVRVSGQPVAVVVWRVVEAEGTRVLRIVDIVGAVDWLARAHGHLQELTIAAGAEYIDLVQTGVDPGALAAGGFVTIGEHPDLVIPNYFSPFERRNVVIEFAYKVAGGETEVRLFRADSDQDRPNRVVELG